MAAADKIGPWRWDKGAATGSRAGHILPERAELGLRCGVMLSQGLLCVVAGTPPPAQDPPLPPQQKTARPPLPRVPAVASAGARGAVVCAGSAGPRLPEPGSALIRPSQLPLCTAWTQPFGSWEFAPAESLRVDGHRSVLCS